MVQNVAGGTYFCEIYMTDLRSIRKTGICDTREELTVRATALHKLGLSHREIGEELMVSNTTIQRVLNGDPDTGKNKFKPPPEDCCHPLTPTLNKLWRMQPEVLYEDEI